MRKELLLWASLCLLLSGAFRPLDAAPETEDEVDADGTDTVSPTVAPAHPSCADPADTGPCRAAFRRFFFNMQTGQCEAFIYGGCRGNKNRFLTLEQCKQRCLPGWPGLCALKPEVGLCRASFIRFFYNPRTQRCEKFVYGGCGGNSNNFQTKAKCQDACGGPEHGSRRSSPAPSTLAPSTPAPPTPPPTPLPADEGAEACEFSIPSWCLTEADRGPCLADKTRFYYDSEAGTCLTFSYSGCGGNENNFVSEQACLEACKKELPNGNSREPPPRRIWPGSGSSRAETETETMATSTGPAAPSIETPWRLQSRVCARNTCM